MANRNPFTRDEIVLCIYAARYGDEAIGGIDAIHALQSRSRASIQMKIANIVAMCDERGISRSAEQRVLSGLAAGESGRRTNWDVLSEFADVPQDLHLHECERIIAGVHAWPGELRENEVHREGSRHQVLVNAYERDPVARRKCIEHYGSSCVVCGFDSREVFGLDAEGFIHVHHLIPLAEIGTKYVVDPIRDLRPVCPNCHAVIHLGGVTRSIDAVCEMIQHAADSQARRVIGG